MVSILQRLYSRHESHYPMEFLPNKYVNNFVRNYSRILLHIHYGFTKAITQRTLFVTMFVTPSRHLSNEPQHSL